MFRAQEAVPVDSGPLVLISPVFSALDFVSSSVASHYT